MVMQLWHLEKVKFSKENRQRKFKLDENAYDWNLQLCTVHEKNPI